MKNTFKVYLRILENLQEEYNEKNHSQYFQHCEEITEAISRVKEYISFHTLQFKTEDNYREDIEFFTKMGRLSLVCNFIILADEIREDIEVVEGVLLGYKERFR